MFRPVEADNGAIGGSNSHEFTALSEFGESEIAYCEKCDMAATVERAACKDDPAQNGLGAPHLGQNRPLPHLHPRRRWPACQTEAAPKLIG